MRFRDVGIGRNERISERTAEADAPEDMPLTEKMALLRIRRGGPESLSAKVLARIEAETTDRPDSFDETKLREAHYIRWNVRGQFHELLPPGLMKVQQIARDLALAYQIHHMTLRPAQSRSNMGAFGHCSCGWYQQVGRSRSDERRLQRRASEHLSKCSSGHANASSPGEAAGLMNPGAVRTVPPDAAPGMNSEAP